MGKALTIEEIISISKYFLFKKRKKNEFFDKKKFYRKQVKIRAKRATLNFPYPNAKPFLI